MAGANGSSTQGLDAKAELVAEVRRYGFFSALRLLEKLHPELPRIGRAARPSREAVRLGQEPALDFATSMLASYQDRGGTAPDRLDVLFLGMFGPNGPLPLHLTEYARERDHHEHDPTFRRFADVFHHRMLALFYRAWADAQPAVSLDRPDDDRFFTYVGALVGLCLPSSQGRDALPDYARLHLAGLLAMQNRPAEGLQRALEHYLRVPVALDEFVAEWLELPHANRLRLGESEQSGVLGVSAMAGARTFYCQGRFRIACGPLDLGDFRRLLPGSESLPRLRALVRSYAGDDLAWELQLVLKREQVPQVQLGHAGELGWTSWLGRRVAVTDAGDVVVHPAQQSRTTRSDITGAA